MPSSLVEVGGHEDYLYPFIWRVTETGMAHLIQYVVIIRIHQFMCHEGTLSLVF